MRSVWLLLLLPLLLPPLAVHPASRTESSGAESSAAMVGALGGSVIFHLKTSPPIARIHWLKTNAKEEISNVAILTALLSPEVLCKLDVSLPVFQGRLEASSDCRRLQVRDLRQGDSGIYTAHIQRMGARYLLEETFDLQVYKHLSEADLAVCCHKTVNGSRQLRCRAGPLEDDVMFSWAGASKARPWGKSTVLELSASDLVVTCHARNPIGMASRTVSVMEICEGVHSVQVSSLLLGVTVAVLILTKVIISACVFAKWPCCLERTQGVLALPAHLRLRRRGAAQRRNPPPS